MNLLLRAGPLALAALVGLVVFDGQFVYDDVPLLLENPVVNGGVPVWEAFGLDFWGRDSSQGFTTWRPLMPMLWAQWWALWPNEPLPFRALSVLFHAFAVYMCMRFTYRLDLSREATATTGALFALHPLNTEAVSAIAGQADMMSFSLVLVACLIALGPQTLRSGVLCAFVFLIAVLFKESAVIFTPLAALLFILRPGSTEARSFAVAPIALLGIGVVALQLALPRAAGISTITSNLAHQAEGGMRFLLGLYNLGRALIMTVWPLPIAPNHGYAAVELQIGSLAFYAALGGILLAAGLVAGAWAVQHRQLKWVAALCFLYAPALLQTHWFVRLITDLAERLLYPSILGISMLITIAIFRFARAPAVRVATIATLGMSFFLASYTSRRAWTEEDTLWTHAVRVEPRAALHHHNVSNTYFHRGEVDRGAYHRLIYTYLIHRYPEAVQWDVINAIESLPIAERFAELPEALGPSDPCPLVRVFSIKAMEYQPLHDYVMQHWHSRYPRCGPWNVE